MTRATWEACRDDFGFDGAFIDLIAPGTGPAEWNRFWSALLAGAFAPKAFRDGESITLPESADWFFAEREVACVMATVTAGPVTAHCHFFGGDLEVDIDPREVLDGPAFQSVLELMRSISAAVGLPIYAVAEGGDAAEAFLRMSPDGQAEFLPGRSGRNI